MTTTTLPDLKAISGMSKEMRDELAATFDALSKWRDELETVNDRCLGQVLDRTSKVARAMGWPDQAIKTTREQLETASKVQTEMIDQIVEAWRRQLKSTTAPMAVPRNFAEQMPAFGLAFPGAMPEFNPLAPWTFWLQAAEMWQRTWMGETPTSRGYRPH